MSFDLLFEYCKTIVVLLIALVGVSSTLGCSPHRLRRTPNCWPTTFLSSNSHSPQGRLGLRSESPLPCRTSSVRRRVEL